MAVLYLTVQDVLAIHQRVIQEFGGDPGIRDRGLLESAIAMAQATFDGRDLHLDLATKAGATHYHLCANHPFLDGNKRVALTAAEVFLLLNGMELIAKDEKVEELTLGVAEGKVSKAAVLEFFSQFVQAASKDESN